MVNEPPPQSTSTRTLYCRTAKNSVQGNLKIEGGKNVNTKMTRCAKLLEHEWVNDRKNRLWFYNAQ